MKFRNIIKTSAIAGIVAVLAVCTAHAAGPCDIIKELGTPFRVLRTLAFVGAVFCIAGWAWGYISAGKIDKWGDEAKTKGVALLVGFALLFGVGMVITALPYATGCGADTWSVFR